MIEDGEEQASDENDDDDEVEEAKAATKKSASATKETDRRKRELITMGKAKGFLTYDEINDHMPENIVSSDQIDDWLSTLGGEGIEVVDSASQVKVSEKRAGEDDDEEEEEATDKEEGGGAKAKADAEEEEDDGYSKTNDPVRM